MNFRILEKYNKPGPRYTSYPPATFFNADFNNDSYIEQVKVSNSSEPNNISLYIHIPFCNRLCHFCGCNTSIMGKPDYIERYVNALLKEIDTVSQHIDTSRTVTQIHWGGGTPNSISLDYTQTIMQKIFNLYKIDANAEIAMECSPAHLEFEDIDRLAKIGFNRLSLGIQDFNDEVLKNVNREPSQYPVENLVNHMKEVGFEGVNLDLIYGLPGQTPESFEDSIEKAIKISPDRIVTFSYAHVPWVKSAQKKLETIGLPGTEEKLDMFGIAYELLTKNGYVSIGMDHYAKPDDSLSAALQKKKLHRNFQGYCTRETTGQVYGFGSSSISQLTGSYSQNQKNINKYIEEIEQNGIAVEKGYLLNELDSIRRTVINDIMCNGYLDFNQVAEIYKTTAEEIEKIVEYNPKNLNEFIEDNLLHIDGKKIILEPEGFFVVRNIAMKFDPLLTEGTGQYSKTV